MSEANKSIVRRFVEEVINRGDLGAVDELLAPGYLDHGPLIRGLPTGREGAKRLYALLHAGFPDLEVSIEDFVAEGERVALRSIWRGTHKGDFLKVAPTGKVVVFENLELLRVQHGQILEHWSMIDLDSLLHQLQTRAEEEYAMKIEANKAIVRRIYDEYINQEKKEVIDGTFAPDVVVHDPLMGVFTGIEAFKQLLNVFDTAFPGHRVRINAICAEGEWVTVLHTHTARHTGPFMGLPPTGKEFVVNGVEVYRLEHGKVVEFWRHDDDMGLVVQLGIVPKLARPA